MKAKNFPGVAATLLTLFCAAPHAAGAQQTVALPDQQPSAISTEAVLRQLTQASGVVFAGEVIAVRRPAGFGGSGQDAAEGLVTIEFRVDEAVLGCTTGSIFTVREWAGLWTGPDRYRVGQRLLVFLHSANRNGLSSPVGGRAGLVPLRGGGHAPGPYDASTGTSEWLADLRWVDTQALREGVWASDHRTTPVQPARPVLGRTREDLADRNNAAIATDPFLPNAGPLAHSTALPQASGTDMRPLSQLLGLCRAWVRASDGAL